MNFNNNKFLFKELVNTFSYTTATQNRDVYTDVSINGRRYTKYGTLQAVTFVGNLYNVGDKQVLVIGMAKQHPYDTKVNKNMGYEIAHENMLNDPCIMIEVNGKFSKYRFKNIVENYLSTIKLHFIKTRGEIEADGKDPKNYNR